MEVVVWEAMEHAAESTIAVAAAAMLWSGADDHGVLAHIAGRDAWKMALARHIYANLVEKQPELADDDSYDALPPKSADFDLAALPARAVRKWASRVNAAGRDTQGEVDRLTDSCEQSGYEIVTSDKLLREKAKLAALQTIALWGRDPLQLEGIEASASAVTTDGVTVPA
jgi:hypothetical protein